MDKELPKFVTTDCDLWNSADETHFFVPKGIVKELPEEITPIIDDALNQKLLRVPTPEEMHKYEFDNGLEKSIQDGEIPKGLGYEKSMLAYSKLLKSKEEKKMSEDAITTEEKIEEEVKETTDTVSVSEPESVPEAVIEEVVGEGTIPEAEEPEVKVEMGEPVIPADDETDDEESEVEEEAESE